MEYSINFSDINIKHHDVNKLIGYKDNDVPLLVQGKIHEIIEESTVKCDLKGGYKIYRNVFVSQHELILENIKFNTKEIIASGLENSVDIAILLCTVGQEISKWSSELFKGDDPLKAYIADLIASIMVEKVADFVQHKIENEASLKRLRITNRYSPGYCGWDIIEQHKLFSLLPKNFLGISLNKEALMIPVKSISAIVGLGANVEKKDYQCTDCERKDCLMILDKKHG
jgi:cobalamin-dependent methionine synthase-like protein